MSAIISVMNLKGGVGKTSIVVNLAAQLANRGRVIILDLDPQKSATMWSRQAQPTSSKRLDLSRDVYSIEIKGRKPALAFRSELTRLMEDNRVNYALIDTPPQLSDPALVAALLSDIVLVPVTPSPLDLWAAKAGIDAAKDAREARKDGKPQIVLVPSKVIPGTVIGRDLPETLKAWGELVSPPISQRVAMAESVIAGQTIDQYAPGSPGHNEFKQLGDYVFTQLR